MEQTEESHRDGEWVDGREEINQYAQTMDTDNKQGGEGLGLGGDPGGGGNGRKMWDYNTLNKI